MTNWSGSSRSSTLVMVVGAIMFLLMLPSAHCFSAPALFSPGMGSLITSSTPTSLHGCRRLGDKRRRKQRGSELAGSTRRRKMTNRDDYANTIVSYREHGFLGGDTGSEDFLDKVLDKMETYQSKWERKITSRRQQKSRRAKKFLLVFLGMGALSCMFPVAFFISGIVFSIFPMVTFFTVSGIMAMVMPVLGPLLLVHFIASAINASRNEAGQDEMDALKDPKDEERERRERQITEALRTSLEGWNESLEFLKEQESVKLKLEVEANQLYSQAKKILESTNDSNNDETTKDAKAKQILAQRQVVLDRKKQVTQLVVQSKSQADKMEENVQKLSRQWNAIKSSTPQATTTSKSSGNSSSSSSSLLDDLEDDPLLEKFRRQGIDI